VYHVVAGRVKGWGVWFIVAGWGVGWWGVLVSNPKPSWPIWLDGPVTRC